MVQYHFKTVEIPSIDDPNTRAMSLQSGDVDMAVNIGPGEIGLFKITISSRLMKLHPFA